MNSDTLNEQMPWHLAALAAENLRDIARNPAADWKWRKGAVRVLLERGYTQYANHHDLQLIRLEVESEDRAKQDVIGVVESSIESEIPQLPDSPDDLPALRASFTTANMFQEEVVQNPDVLGDDALVDGYISQVDEPSVTDAVD